MLYPQNALLPWNLHGNLNIFVAQVIFITCTIAGQNYLLSRISLKKHWGGHKLLSWNSFTNLRWLQSQNVHFSVRIQRIVVTVIGGSHCVLKDYLEVIVCVPWRARWPQAKMHPCRLQVVITDKHHQPGAGVGHQRAVLPEILFG